MITRWRSLREAHFEMQNSMTRVMHATMALQASVAEPGCDASLVANYCEIAAHRAATQRSQGADAYDI